MYNIKMESVIKHLREENRYTQVQLAKILGISRQALIKYEAMEQEPSIVTVRNLAKLFKVDYACLIDNQLPLKVKQKDEANLMFIKNCFLLLNEEEKYVVTEMIRIMAGK